MASVDEQSAAKTAFEVIMLEHAIAARTSRLVESGRFVVLADAVEAICLTNEESQFSDEKDAFAVLIQTMLSSASGRHAHFKARSSLRYILEALAFYAHLQLNFMHPRHPSNITFGALFADWFLGENSEPTDV